MYFETPVKQGRVQFEVIELQAEDYCFNTSMQARQYLLDSYID